MRGVPQRTSVAVVADYCRRRIASSSRLCRDTVAAEIVETYYRMGFDRVVQVDFQRGGSNVSREMKTNGERIWRWLDDVSKDTTLLPSNFLPVVLAAMPLDLRVGCAQELLAMCGLTVGICGSQLASDNLHVLLLQVLKEGGEANVAFASLLDGAADFREKVRRARAELVEARAAFEAAIMRLDAELVVMP